MTKYSDNGPQRSAADIAYEVVLKGKSTGWGGSLEDFEAVKKILAPLNIVYTDDMFGTWERR